MEREGKSHLYIDSINDRALCMRKKKTEHVKERHDSESVINLFIDIDLPLASLFHLT